MLSTKVSFFVFFPIFVYDIPETFPIIYVAAWISFIFSHVLLAVSLIIFNLHIS